MEPRDGAGPYSIGSDVWPGLSKLIEECGEVIQVAGKLLGANGDPNHWDGSDLRLRLQEELADLTAAIQFVEHRNDLDGGVIWDRTHSKLRKFDTWHEGRQ
jgi:NTP pyrophosphatase (non-canonical NTP hydrolase)